MSDESSSSTTAENSREEEKVEKKKVQVPGFTEGMRKKELERLKKKMNKKGWELIEYTDDGFSNSQAMFRRPLDYKETSMFSLGNNNSSKTSTSGAIGHFIVFCFLFGAFSKLPFYLNIALFSIAIYALYAKTVKEHFERFPAAKTVTKHAAFAFGFALLSSFSQYQMQQKIEKQTAKAEKIIDETKSLIEKGKLREAKDSISGALSLTKAKNSNKAESLNKMLRKVLSKSEKSAYIMNMPKKRFESLLNKKFRKDVLKNPKLNKKFISELEKEAPKLKDEYYSNLKARRIAQEKKEAKQKRERKARKRRQAILNKIGQKPENGPWNGSVRPAERWLEDRLKDPDSMKDETWYKVQLVERNGRHYWRTAVKFRAKNGFGAYTMNAYEFYIRNGRVIDANSLR